MQSNGKFGVPKIQGNGLRQRVQGQGSSQNGWCGRVGAAEIKSGKAKRRESGSMSVPRWCQMSLSVVRVGILTVKVGINDVRTWWALNLSLESKAEAAADRNDKLSREMREWIWGEGNCIFERLHIHNKDKNNKAGIDRDGAAIRSR